MTNPSPDQYVLRLTTYYNRLREGMEHIRDAGMDMSKEQIVDLARGYIVAIGDFKLVELKVAGEYVAELVRWTFETAPKGLVLFRQHMYFEVVLAVMWNADGILLGSYEKVVPYDAILTFFTHSLDGGKTWMRCGTIVGQPVEP